MKLADLGGSWRETLMEKGWLGARKTWTPAYDNDARFMLDQSLSRMRDAVTVGGRLSGTRDCSVTLERLDPAKVRERGDLRYKSDRLAEFLRKYPELDLVPIVCSRSRMDHLVLDGHHRLRAYAIAGRRVPAFVITVRPGSGLVDVRTG